MDEVPAAALVTSKPYWPAPNANQSCLSISGDKVNPPDYGATTNSLGLRLVHLTHDLSSLHLTTGRRIALDSGVGAAHMGLVYPERHIHHCCDADIMVALAGTAVLRSPANAARCWPYRGQGPNSDCQPGRRLYGCFLCLSVSRSLLVRIIATSRTA